MWREHAEQHDTDAREHQKRQSDEKDNLTHPPPLAVNNRGVLAFGVMTRNSALAGHLPDAAAVDGPRSPVDAAPAAPRRSIVLVGLMGAGKSAIGRRLAARLGLPFRDSDMEIEAAAGRSIAELFSQFGEPHFRAGERRVVRRLLDGPPIVLATGGGAFMDPSTRAAIRHRGTSIWLRAPMHVLLRRVALRRSRPLLANDNPADVLKHLMEVRSPIYAEADIVVDCGDDTPDQTTHRVASAFAAWRPPHRLTVRTGSASYDVVVGDGLLRRAGALLAPVLPQKRVVVISDTTVAALHGPADRWEALADTIHADVLAHGFDAERNTFTQSYGAPGLDAALLMIPRVGFLPPKDPRVLGTITAIQDGLTEDGLVKRYDTSGSDDGLSGGEGMFLACSFWLVDALHLAGRQDEARTLFERLLTLRNDVGLLSEEWDPKAGRQLGNTPQAFSHFPLVTSALQLHAGRGHHSSEPITASAVDGVQTPTTGP